MTRGDADALPGDVDDALPGVVDEGFRVGAGEVLPVGPEEPADLEEAAPVGAGEDAFPVCGAPVAGEAFALPVCVLVDVCVGEKIAGAGLPEELEHAQISAGTRIAKVAPPTAVSLALAAVPVVIMRTFMKPPYMRAARPYR